MSFPRDRLGVIIEAAIGPLTSDYHSAWPWLDMSNRLFAQSFNITRGQENESNGLQPASATFELGNRDGWLTPNNPASPWWPYYRRGTPVRISLEGAAKGAYLPGGVTNYWTTPHVSADNISGDLDVRVRIHPDTWAVPDDAFQPLLGIWGPTGTNQQWCLILNGSGFPELDIIDSAGTYVPMIASEVVASMRPIWLGATLDVDNGSGGHTVSFYRSDDDTPPADITTWTLIESIIMTGTIALRTGSTENVKVGARHNTEAGTRGQIFAAQVRSGINGTLTLNVDFTAPAIGATSFTGTGGRTWTAIGNAAISTYRTRFAGTIDSITTLWPYGNHNAAIQSFDPSECHTRIVVSDVVRRLGQGNKPLESTLRRLALAPGNLPHVLGYWPMEDASGAIMLASGVPGGPPMAITGIAAGSDSSLHASGPLPTAPSDKPSSWQVAVTGGDSPTHWAVDIFWRAETGPPDPTAMRIFTAWCEGSIGEWTFSVSSSTFWLAAWNNSGGRVLNFSSGFSATQFGPWMLTRLEVVQNGGNVDWSVTFANLETGGGGSYNDTIAGTIGSVRTVRSNLDPDDAPNGLSIGHLVVTDGQLPMGWLAGADTAWAGESAARRIARLADEEGLEAEVIGDPTIWQSARGDLGYSQPMGYQARASLLTLLDQAAEVDLGFLSSRPTAPGFIYRCQATLNNQDYQMTLDASTDAVTVPLEPTLDDQRLRNDITVPIIDGTSGRAVDQESIDAEGLYRVEVPAINGVGGVKIQDSIIVTQSGLDLAIGYQQDWQAGWRLALGVLGATVRYPQIHVDLSLAPELMPAWHALCLGDRIQLVGLPNQHPAEPVDLIVEYIGDAVTPTTWIGTISGSPSAPYTLGVLDT